MTEEQAAVIRAITERYAGWKTVDPPEPKEAPPVYVEADSGMEKYVLEIRADGTTRAMGPGGPLVPTRLYGALRKDGSQPPRWGRGLPKHAVPFLDRRTLDQEDAESVFGEDVR